MAAGLGFKEFFTGDILTASDANGYLMSQTVMVFASSTARSAAITSPQEGMVTYLKDTNAIEYYTGSAWTAVGGGGASGKVLQVVSGTYSTATTITSNSFTDSGLSLSITPTASTSKVLVMIQQPYYLYNLTDQTGAGYQIVRNSTNIVTTQKDNNWFYVGSGANAAQTKLSPTILTMDSPASTSSLTYKIQWALNSTANSGTIILQPASDTASIILMEIGA